MAPKLMQVVVANDKPLPKPVVPYYAFAQEGLFLHKNTQIGTVLIKEKTPPYTVGSIGFKGNGQFIWTGEKIPGKIIGQATDFFRRIYKQHGTEAEVLLTMHNETGEYRIFVPLQRTSHTGVHSIHENTHIDPAYSLVGTIHSHCNFSAFHSGTDSSDASDMEGVHFTIGMVLNDIPQIVAMVTMNGSEFHYSNPAEIANLDFNDHPAPEWWDAYVFPSNPPATKPKSFISITEDIWNQFLGHALRKKVEYKPSESKWAPKTYAWPTSEYGMYGYKPQEIRNPYGNRAIVPYKAPTIIPKPKKNDQWNDANWTVITDAIDNAEDAGVFTDADWKTFKGTQYDNIEKWRALFEIKIEILAAILEDLGADVRLLITDKAIYQNHPNQVGMDDLIGGEL